MLSDHERKVLRILFNLGHHPNKILTLELLEIKTGYALADILRALRGLAAQRYIAWPGERVEEIKVIEGWERGQGELKPISRPKRSPADIWTMT